MRLPTCAVLVLMAGSMAPAFGRTKGMPALYKQGDQVAEIAGLTVPEAKQRCDNWSWAAGLEALLGRENVALAQSFWVMRVHGGEVCVEGAPDMERIMRAIDGEYVLDDGRKVRLASHYTAGAPTDIGSVIRQLKLGRSCLVFWRGHAYLLQSANYDEYIYPNAQRLYIVRHMTLLDPFV